MSPFPFFFGRSGVFIISSMFEIPILYVACDVKIVKKRVSSFCSRVLRKKYSYKKKLVLAGFFFSKKNSFLEERRGAGERRIE